MVAAADAQGLAEALKAAVTSPEFIEKMRGNFVTALHMSPDQFSLAMRDEAKVWGALLEHPELRSLREK